MRLSAIATAFLLPLFAAAEEPLSTVTSTSTLTLTQTITLQRAAAATESAGLNGTTSFSIAPSRTSGISSASTGAAGALGPANGALLAMAGMAVAVLL